MVQGGDDGRDHRRQPLLHHVARRMAVSRKAPTCMGATDDFGFNVIQDPVHVHDLNATLLHLLGLDHERLTFRLQGRDYRLTDVHGNVVAGVLS